MNRIYLSTIVGDGVEETNTPWMAAWRAVIGNKTAHGATGDAESNHALAVHTVDTDTAEHNALVADNRIRYVPKAILHTKYADLTQGQQDAIMEIVSRFDYNPAIFTSEVRVVDILIYLNGWVNWSAIKGMGVED